MRKLYITAAAVAMLAFTQACSDDILSAAYDADRTSFGSGLTLDVSVPAVSRASITPLGDGDDGDDEDANDVDYDNDLNGVFGVFAFDKDSTLLWMRLTGDTNDSTNLRGTDPYEDYTDSPAIMWHPHDPSESETPGMNVGRLYIEADEYTEPISLLVITNIDDLENKFYELGLTPGSSTKEDVIDSLYVFDFDVTDETQPKYMPMAGEAELENGIQLGAKGKIYLRRSLAKIVVNFTWVADDELYDFGDLNPDYDIDNNGDTIKVEEDSRTVLERFEQCGERVFIPDSIMVTNIYNRATVYSPRTDSINVPKDTMKISRIVPVASPIYDAETNTFSTSVELYIPETWNTCENAYFQGQPTENPRSSVFLIGKLYNNEYRNNEIINAVDDYWYRLDFLSKEDGVVGIEISDSVPELKYLLRNTRYTFDISNISIRGKSSDTEALAMDIPHNYRMSGSATKNVIINDDDIVSINVDKYVYDKGSGEPIYVAVSATSVTLPRTEGAVTRVKVITNYGDREYMSDEGGWNIDISLLPSKGSYDDENWSIYDTGVAFSFIYDSNSESLWVYLDHPELVEVGETYIFYISAASINKKMRINITDGEYGENTDDSTETKIMKNMVLKKKMMIKMMNN